MSNLFFLADLIWAMGSILRLFNQVDSARYLREQGKLERMPSPRELVPDAALWWLWVSLDLGRWMRGKLWR